MWKATYIIKIQDPTKHYVQVRLVLSNQKMPKTQEIFIPSWSPGSYLTREYARHLRCLNVTNQVGESLQVEMKSKSSWNILIDETKTKTKVEKIEITYEVYCHEISVRTSYIDESHAFLHGPTYLMGLAGDNLKDIEIEFHIPPQWSKISTALKPVDGLPKEIFKYQALNYDELLDTPVELGCHETDGFMVGNVPHEIAIYGVSYPHKNNLKADIKKITETVTNYMGEIPFDHYLFLIHFLPNVYGGLEHLNSTVLMFDGRKLAQSKDYFSWLALVAHEYFHAWNVKRIRPIELGPFNYQSENYTTMLWLAEGLTKMMDDYFVLLSGLATPTMYLEALKNDLNLYYKTPGRKFDSLESSSFGAWIKLYRPHENLSNTTISYYLKGGLVFLCLHLELKQKNKSIKDVISKLWKFYKKNPNVGVTTEDFMTIVKQVGAGEELLDIFDDYISTTKEINFNKHFVHAGLEIEWDKAKLDFDVDVEFSGDRIIVKSVMDGGAAHQYGLNAQDEILSINGARILRSDWSWFLEQLQENTYYTFLVSRNAMIVKVEVMPKMSQAKIKNLKITDQQKFNKAFELE